MGLEHITSRTRQSFDFTALSLIAQAILAACLEISCWACKQNQDSWPQSATTMGLLVLPLELPKVSTFWTTSMPLVTLPKTTCLPSNHSVLTVHRKNCNTTNKSMTSQHCWSKYTCTSEALQLYASKVAAVSCSRYEQMKSHCTKLEAR